MTEALAPNLEAKIRKFGRTDFIVGISSYNNADSIEYVILRVAEGLSKFFPGRKSLIIVSDGGSTDGTIEIASSLRLHAGIKKIVALYKGISGKGSAVRLILEAAKILDADGVALVDSDLRSILPEWIELLLKPLEERADLVAPLYKRYKYDGTITNQIVFPFTRAVYGIRIRQPIGGEFGISRVLIEHLLSSPLWANPYTPRFGIDVFITHTAIAFKLPVVEAFLGSKIHSVKDPTEHLAPMFRQVVGSMFDAMALYEDAWRDVRGSLPVPVVKIRFKTKSPEPFTVDVQAPVRTFKQGFIANRSLFESYLPTDLYSSLLAESERSDMNLYIPVDVWAKIAYTFAAAFKKERQQDKRDLLLDAFRFCWTGRLGTFFQETLDMTGEEVEKKVLQEAKIFEELKPYLLGIY